jgi:hypothetical protein
MGDDGTGWSPLSEDTPAFASSKPMLDARDQFGDNAWVTVKHLLLPFTRRGLRRFFDIWREKYKLLIFLPPSICR